MNLDFANIPWQYVAIPLISAGVGWITNYIAVKMIFRPRRPIRLPFYTLQGLIPRRQKELAIKLGETIEDKLISHRDVQHVIQSIEIRDEIGHLVEQQVDQFITNQISSNPMIALFLQGSIVDHLKSSLITQVQNSTPDFLDRLMKRVEEGLSFKDIVREKVEAFDFSTLEEIIYDISAKELRAIEILGGVLGFVIGLIQVGILMLDRM